ncbi:gamma-glutamylcyclotransferase family protein [Neolewinella litorea]|uniref:Gamma-glutamylcyclotransferase n=1 Tax=Neolewinella litorea TaxID=2562452 RepID=A0A4S4NNI8_9BACT|nr:gamma-glutamylcyclotransferase family protein [Neolewinella litorea]THH40577.1 gamma-glutamylcyclotransferase [Neolewinella litorea]
MSRASEYLFVYGTLRSDIPSSMSKFLRRRATLVGKATVEGRLIDLGGYPGFIAGGGTTKGELYRINADQEAETWQMLDAYEGVSGLPSEEYRRIELEVRVGGGGKFHAQTYEYQLPAGNKPEIPHGDYPPFYRNNPDHRKFTGND